MDERIHIMKSIAKQEPLFELPEQLSPRLAWMKKHVLEVKDTEFDVDGDGQFIVWENKRPTKHKGHTEDDALTSWAKSKHFHLWNEEGI